MTRMADRGTLAFLLPDFRGGGAERVALTLIEEYVRRGYSVDLLLLQKRGELLPLVPSCVDVIDLNARRIRAALRPLVRYFRVRRPLAIQISMWPLTVVGILAHRLTRSTARLVVSDHIVLSKQYGDQPGAYSALRATTRLFYPFAHHRVFVSLQAADDFAVLSRIPRENLQVVYNPVPKRPQMVVRTDVEALWGTSDGRVLSVGTLKAQKNHALLIKSFARVRQKRAAKLMILGDGPLLPELKSIAAAEGIGSAVLFPGFCVDPWPYYASANVFALSSDYEGYPLVLVEALRAGINIVSTDCESGPNEILDGGKYGILVPCGREEELANGILSAFENPRSPQALLDRAEELSGDAIADRYLELMIGQKGVTTTAE